MKKHFSNFLEALNSGIKAPIIIGLTGYTGSGNSTTKSLLTSQMKIEMPGYKAIYDEISLDKISQMDERVYTKLKRYWDEYGWENFIPIEVSKIIFAFLLYELISGKIKDEKYATIIKYIKDNKPKLGGIQYFFHDNEKNQLKVAKSLIKSYTIALKIYQSFKKSYDRKEMGKFITLLQDLGDDIRRYGTICNEKERKVISADNIYSLPRAIDRLIKAHILLTNSEYFVIDTFKNPYEIEYFKNRYSHFYLIGIMRNIKDRENDLLNVLYKGDYDKINKRERSEILDKSKSNLPFWITSQDIDECLKKVDMYITNYYSSNMTYEHLRFGIIKLLTLINRPGCVTPSQDERCMQLAMTVRLSSGCISRQVGALIIDKERRIVGVGWNDPPKTQIPCSLRSCDELVNNATKEVFSKYENSPGFVNYIKTLNLKHEPFCFREELSNYKTELLKKTIPKQAEYTRALHAEENALFQASRNMNGSLEGSTLYTSSSTCTLCAKKSYQLGVERIVYIDEYYDIAIDQTLKAGQKVIMVDRFSGIIGEAFNKLYTAPMPEKSMIQLNS